MTNYLVILLAFSLDLQSQIAQVKKLEEKSNYDSAFIIANQGLRYSISTKDWEFASAFSLRIGTILCKSAKCEQGLTYYIRALGYSNRSDKPDLSGEIHLGIGAAYQDLDMNDSALYHYEKALPLLSQKNDQKNLLGLEANISLIYEEMDRTKPSMQSLLRVVAEQKKHGFTENLIGSYNNLARLYYHQSNPQKALQIYDSAIQLHSKIGNNILIADTYFGKALCFQNMKNYQLANHFFLIYDSIISPFYHEDYSNKILELETKYRTAEVERDNALKQAQIIAQNQRMIYLYGTAGILTLAIIAIHLYNEQRKKNIKAVAAEQDRENKQRINKLLNDQELKSAYAMLTGQEKAHKRIAQELHDNLGSILATLNMFADSLQNKKDPDAQKQLASRISDVARQANETTRQISHSLDSGVLKHFGLEIAIKELMEALNESGSIAIESHVQITDQLDSELSMNIYRILQELVNNTLKHARASKITLDLNQIKGHLSVIYQDNGIGFKLDEINLGMGLENLESRVEGLEGTITIDSHPGHGTTTIIDVPVS